MYRFFLLFWINLLWIEGFCEEKPIVILISSYNNQNYVKKNIESVLNQDYNNYRVIYIDDASTDKTLAYLIDMIKSHPKKDRFTIYRNKKNLGAMENHYMAIHTCKKWEIVTILDGDDWFYSDSVLNIINAVYQDPNVWLTWGSYIEYPEGKIGSLSRYVDIKDLTSGNLRSQPWKTSHLRTFYAGLFQKIKKEEFQNNGKFFLTACDLAEMYPMLEIAREKTRFIPDLLYVYNKTNPLNDFKIHAKERDKIVDVIKNKKIHKKLNSL